MPKAAEADVTVVVVVVMVSVVPVLMVTVALARIAARVQNEPAPSALLARTDPLAIVRHVPTVQTVLHDRPVLNDRRVTRKSDSPSSGFIVMRSLTPCQWKNDR
jgi:hypothetical protein